MPSYLDRIALRRAALAPVAVGLVATALASAAQAAIYTIGSPSPNGWAFNPLTGASTAAGSSSGAHPVYFNGCIGPRSILDGSLHSDPAFSFVGPASGFFSLNILSAGVTVDTASSFRDAEFVGYGPSPGTYDDTTLHYLGFRYTDQGPGLNETYYGWIEFVMPDDNQVTVLRFAIGGDAQSIVTGSDVSPIPEPATAGTLLGALALGAAALSRRRRA
jgi:MYXO-CTERM domain-containing protein